ncbi:hypothetical protein Trydic_g18489 [Trypoxylus dichotomus]
MNFRITARLYFEKEKRNGNPVISVDTVHERVTNALGISMDTIYNIKQKKEITPAGPLPSTSTAPYKLILLSRALNVSEKIKMDVKKTCNSKNVTRSA